MSSNSDSKPKSDLTEPSYIERLGAMGYLDQNHYVEATDEESLKVQKSIDGVLSKQSDSISSALRRFQIFYGLKETGIPDPPTLKILEMPGCGNTDPDGPEGLAAGFAGWPTADITYSIGRLGGIVSLAEMRAVVSTACQIWSGACALTFRETISQGLLRFSFGADEHGDGFPFDGQHMDQSGIVLAHAFYPDYSNTSLAGEVHFDSDERWSIAAVCPQDRKDLLTVTIHEIGHALGLRHTGDELSVMFSKYQGVRRQLHSSDISNIRAIYGA